MSVFIVVPRQAATGSFTCVTPTPCYSTVSSLPPSTCSSSSSTRMLVCSSRSVGQILVGFAVCMLICQSFMRLLGHRCCLPGRDVPSVAVFLYLLRQLPKRLLLLLMHFHVRRHTFLIFCSHRESFHACLKRLSSVVGSQTGVLKPGRVGVDSFRYPFTRVRNLEMG